MVARMKICGQPAGEGFVPHAVVGRGHRFYFPVTAPNPQIVKQTHKTT